MKFCSKCKQSKAETEFSFKVKSKGKRNSICKVCYIVIHSDYYRANRIRLRIQLRANQRVLEQKCEQLIIEYLRVHPCVDCGETDIVVLQFDHRDPEVKIAAVAELMHKGLSWRRIKAEIDKCDVRCANCHVRKTAKQFGYYKVG